MNDIEKKEQLIKMIIEAEVKVDGYGNIKFTLKSGKQIRYKFTKDSLTTEYKMMGSTKWFRMYTTLISDVNFYRWGEILKMIREKQN